jgi:hypothetical protein
MDSALVGKTKIEVTSVFNKRIAILQKKKNKIAHWTTEHTTVQ